MPGILARPRPFTPTTKWSICPARRRSGTAARATGAPADRTAGMRRRRRRTRLRRARRAAGGVTLVGVVMGVAIPSLLALGFAPADAPRPQTGALGGASPTAAGPPAG